MKILTLMLLMIMTPAMAETTADAVNNTCSKQAQDLASQLKQSVYTDMDNQQHDSIVRISMKLCHQSFSDLASKNTAVSNIAENGDTQERKSSDWFTDYILSGETPDKAGNKRLKRMQHK